MRIRIVLIVCLWVYSSFAIADLPCNTTLVSSSAFVSDVQAELDGAGPGPMVVCLAPTTFTGCGAGVTMTTPFGGHVTLRAQQPNNPPTIDCGSAGRAVGMSVAGSSGVLSNLVIENGIEFSTGLGGAVRLRATNSELTMVNVTVRYTADAAVHVGENGFLTMRNCLFEYNNAEFEGGAVNVASGTVVAYNSRFYANTATRGAVVWAASSEAHVTLVRCIVDSNAPSFRGALFAHSNGVIVLDSSLVVNHTTATAGSGAAASDGTLRLYATTFANNSASNDGGAVLVVGTPSYAFIGNGSVFTGNSAYTGGAVEVQQGVAVFANTRFTDNWTTGDNGAGLHYSSGATGAVSGCEFDANRSENYAGAMYLRSATMALANSTFTRNSADRFGGALVVLIGGYTSVQDCHFEGNTANNDGGTIDIYVDPVVNVSDTTFVSNTGGSGGAIEAESAASLYLFTCHFRQNTATLTRGGGVSVNDAGTFLSATNCTFESNVCSTNGGSVSVAGGAVASLSGGFCTSNFAEVGGCLNIDSSVASVTSFLMSFNSVLDGGGAVFCLDCTVELSGVNITGHTSTLAPAFQCFGVADVALLGTVFIDNTATQASSVFFGSGGELRVHNCRFEGNYGLDGTVFTTGTNVTYLDTVCRNNTVTNAASCLSTGTGAYVVVGRSNFSDNAISDVSTVLELSGALVAEVYDSRFLRNGADSTPGCIAADSLLNTITRCVFVDNYSDLSASGASAAIGFSGDGELHDCLFAGNTGRFSGVEMLAMSVRVNSSNLVFEDGESTLCVFGGLPNLVVVHATNVTSRGNQAYCTMGVVSSSLHVSSSHVSNCTHIHGALIALSGSAAVVSDTVLENNREGSTLHSSVSQMSIENCEVRGNFALGVNAKGGWVTVTNTAFALNSFYTTGGVYVHESGLVQVHNCTFDDNWSTTDFSGALMIVDGTIIARDSAFKSNRGKIGGAATASFSGFYAFFGCAFESNYAELGGAIYCQDISSIVVQDCVFQNNSASILGGALFAFAVNEPAILNGSNFVDNAPDAVYSFLGNGVIVTRCGMTGPSPLVVRGSPTLTVRASSIVSTTPVAFTSVGVGSATVTDSLLASSSGLAVVCQASSLTLESTSSVCSNDRSERFQCTGCTVNGLAGCAHVGMPVGGGTNCRETCELADYCVPSLSVSNAPNLGCLECDGDCYRGTDDCAANSTHCSDSASVAWECTCATGYGNLTSQGTLCSDVDECALGLDDCAASAECINTAGSFTCACPTGFESNGLGCVDIDECALGTSCGVAGECVNEIGSYSCDCDTGYYVVAEASPTCERCSGGYYVTGGYCLPCPGGTYSTGLDNTACTSCPDNASPNATRTGCDCDPGFAPDIAGTCLRVCPLGQKLAGTSVCQDCGVGFYGVSPGTCAVCGELETTATANATSCVCSSNAQFNTSTGLCDRLCGPGLYAADSDCLGCPVGTYSNTTSTQRFCDSCPVVGMITPVTGATSVGDCMCPPGEAVDTGMCAANCGPGYSRPSLSADCEACGAATYTDTFNAVKCTICPANTISPPQSTSVAACTCKVGYYQPLVKAGSSCTPCPPGAECDGGSAPPRALPGYSPDGDGSFVACSPRSSCVGDGKCADGYAGTHCTGCESGFYRVSGYCRPCGVLSALGFVYGLCGLLAVCAALFLGNYRESRLGRIHSLVIGLNALQIVAQFGRLDIAWPLYIQRVYDVLAMFNFSIEIVAPECVFGGGGSSFTTRFVLSMLLPVMFGAVLAGGYVIFLAISVCRDLPSDMAYNVRRAVAQSGAQVLLIVYMPLALAVFEFFDCVPFGSDGTRVVSTSPDVVCGGDAWNSILPFAVIFLIAYPIAVPVAYSVCLFYLRHTWGDDVFVLRLDVFYYESIILLRKLGVAVCLSFVTSSAFIQAGAAVMWIVTLLMVHKVLRPYSFDENNLVEDGCILLVAGVLQLGVMFQESLLSEMFRGLAMLLVLTLLFVVIGVGAVYEYRFSSGVGFLDEDQGDFRVRAKSATESSVGSVGERENSSVDNPATFNITSVADSVDNDGLTMSLAFSTMAATMAVDEGELVEEATFNLSVDSAVADVGLPDSAATEAPSPIVSVGTAGADSDHYVENSTYTGDV